LTNLVPRLYALVTAPQVRALPDQELLARFVTHRDEAAFGVLVDRHAAMVLGVCRRVVKDAHDAEDACQATFLLLARRAASIRKPEALGGWLQRVAYHVALKARTRAARSAPREAVPDDRCRADATAEVSWREAVVILDEEMSRLPSTYRAPLALCYLEGRTQDEAARQLGWSLGALRGRLERGRERLRARLRDRGIHPWAALLASALMHDPPATRVTALADAVGRTLFLSKAKIGAILVLALAIVTATASVACRQIESGSKAEHQAKDKAMAPEDKRVRTDRLGDLLPAEAVARLGTTRFRAGQFISGLMFTPDGKVLISHGATGAVSLWEFPTGREIGGITGKGGASNRSAALSPNGKLIATVPSQAGALVSDVSIQLWDRVSREPVRELGKGPYANVTFSPDGSTLAAMHFDGRIDLWEVDAGRLRRGWKAHGHATIIPWQADSHLAWAARFTAGGKTLVTVHPLEGIRFWDTSNGAKRRELSLLPQPNATDLSPDGKMLAVATRPAVYKGKESAPELSRIRLVDLGTGKELRQLIAAGEPPFGAALGIRSVTFSPDGKKLAARGGDGYLRVWEVTRGTELRRWWNVVTHPQALSFSPDSKTLAVSCGGAIRLLDVASGKEVGVPLENGSMLSPVAFSKDGRTAVTLGHSTVLLWDSATGRLRHRLAGHKERALILGVAVVGNTLYSWADDKTPLVWDLETGKKLPGLPAVLADKQVRAVVTSPDGKLLAVQFHSYTRPSKEPIVIVDVASGKEIQRLAGHSVGVWGAAFPPGGKTLVSWGGDGTARVWDLATGRQRQEIPFIDESAPGQVMAPPGAVDVGRIFTAALSPDGRLLAFRSRRQRFLVIHDVATGKAIRRLDRLPDVVLQMAFTPDSRTLVWVGESESVARLVEVASGKERHHLLGHRGRIWSLAVSADGRRLLTGSVDGTALVWDLAGPLGGQTRPLAAKEQEACWTDLASADPVRAYRAVRQLGASPASLAGRLKPIAPVDEKRLARWLHDLDSEDFTTRKQATAELEALGEGAAAACRRALEEKPALEKRRRLEALVDRQIQAWWSATPERLRAMRAVEALELAGTAGARGELEKLAGGAAGVRLTEEAKAALRRLNRITRP
jgi:RNA polymerase sigma factor (sigma-70 family)